MDNLKQPLSDPAAQPDLTTCDREQIQFPDAIMPHGVLLVVAPGQWQIIGASANSLSLLGIGATQIMRQPLGHVTGAVVMETIVSALSGLAAAARPCLIGCFAMPHSGQLCCVLGHRSGDVFILEFEAIGSEVDAASVIGRSAQVHNSLAAIQATDCWQAGMALLVRELKHWTGFASVLGVRFLDDGSFQTIAEARDAHMPAYLDKRFPRSDIPEPGRQKMLQMPQQYMPDMLYEPVPILMAACEAKPLALDLTYAALRSVSPICRRFYQNMGIQSRLLLSLNDNGTLWGFISCLSDGGHTIPYVDRLAYQGFAEMAALLLIEKEKAALQQQILFNKKQIAAIAKGLEAACDFGVALQGLPQQLAGWLDVNGVALVRDAGITSVGEVPGVELINALAAWLDGQPDYFITDKLASVFGQADAFASSACGLVAIRLLEPGQYLLGLRPEWAHEVTWAGNPEKPMEIDASHGEMRLTPRGSFAEWKQTVKGCARPWQAHEQEAWMELRQTVVFAQNAEKNRVLTVRLEESNQELESFAYIVSHDLQEPLRGIQNFSQLLNQEEATSDLGQRRTWLNAIMSLSGRMHSQIEALLQYSRASQQPLHISHVNLNQLLVAVQEDLAVPIAQSHARITVPRPLPDVYCDAVRLRAVFENLITNAIKYNSQIEKRIEIGFTDSLPLTFYVRDNGIGIKKGHEELIFTLFRRLHGRNDYGGGTGAGLTIAHKHISRQGGQIWLESVVGEGTTFYFTIAPEPQLIKLAST